MLKNLIVDALRILNPALSIRACNGLATKLSNFLNCIDSNVAGAVNNSSLTLERSARALEVLIYEVDKAITSCLGTRKGTTIGKALAGKNARPFIAQTLVLAKHIANLTSSYAKIACGYVSIGTNMTTKLCHKRLAECHNLAVGLALRIEVRASLAATHWQCGKCILEDLLKTKELKHAYRNGRIETKATFVGTKCRVVLNTISTVNLDLALIIYPRNTEHNDALRLNNALEKACLLKLRMSIKGRLDRFKNFLCGLDKLWLIGITRLKLSKNTLRVSHIRSNPQ